MIICLLYMAVLMYKQLTREQIKVFIMAVLSVQLLYYNMSYRGNTILYFRKSCQIYLRKI